MSRSLVTILAVGSIVLLAENIPQAYSQSKGLELGKTFEGELGGKPVEARIRIDGGKSKTGLIRPGYQTMLPITLKAGQAVSITATVTGKERLVGIAVLDPAKNPVAVSGPSPKVMTVYAKTATVKIEEVPANGEFTIVVASSHVGAFSLRVTSGSDEPSREDLEAELKELKKKVEQIEAKLKAMDEKSKK
jgi:hypothetical protein